MAKSTSNKAVVIGVGNYPAPIPKLSAVAADVREVAKVLQSKNGFFSKSGAEVLTDRSASKASIESALSVAFGADPDDTVFIYIAGHGDVENGEYFFLSHDTDIADLAASAVSLKWIKIQFDRCRSKRLFLWLDFCRSGGIIARGPTEDDAAVVARTLEVVRGQGKLILAACTENQRAYESPNGHGLFTGALLRGLKGEAENRGEVTALSLFEYIDHEIGDGRQQPMLFGQMTGRIVLMHYDKHKASQTDRGIDESASIEGAESSSLTSSHWILLSGKFLDVTTVRRTPDGAFSVDLFSDGVERDALVQSLRSPSQFHRNAPIPFAYGNDACNVTVNQISSESAPGGQSWNLVLTPAEDNNRSSLEMTIVENNRQYTPGDIAELRARAILLNEMRPAARGIQDLSILTSEIERSGGGGPLRCIVRDIYESHKNRQSLWRHFAKLAAVYLLKSSGTIEHVLELSIGKVNNGKVAVTFKGVRRRQYSNEELAVISFAGECPLL